MEQPQPFRKENGIMKANLKNIIGLAALGKALHTPAPQPAPKARKEYGMKNYNVLKNQITSRMLSIAYATALAVAYAVSLPQPARAGQIAPPDVPTKIQVPAGNVPFLVGHVLEDHGAHTQNYICLPCPNPSTPAKLCPDTSGFAWLLFTPEATLFNDDGDKQLTTHFFSPNPDEGGTIRATWQHSRDTSTVWGGQAISSTDANFVAKDAIPWLLLPMAGIQEGPTGGDILTATTYIQRVHTHGGVAPADGCVRFKDVGKKAFVPYTADYFFYKDAESDAGD